MNNLQIMRSAKQALSGTWLMAALATLIYLVIIDASAFTYLGILILTGPMYYGYFNFLNANLDYRNAELSQLFSAFSQRFVEIMIAGLLYIIIVSIGLVLLVVPGIILSLGLSMTFLIMLDNPTIKGVDALQASWNMMKGHKWELFCLYIRFIGWILLSILTFGILLLWVQPYIYTAIILFYRQLRGQIQPPIYKG